VIADAERVRQLAADDDRGEVPEVVHVAAFEAQSLGALTEYVRARFARHGDTTEAALGRHRRGESSHRKQRRSSVFSSDDARR
jgi:hypothetical protein